MGFRWAFSSLINENVSQRYSFKWPQWDFSNEYYKIYFCAKIRILSKIFGYIYILPKAMTYKFWVSICNNLYSLWLWWRALWFPQTLGHTGLLKYCSNAMSWKEKKTKNIKTSGFNPGPFESRQTCLWRQCRSRSVGFWRSQLIWICTVCHYVCEFVWTIWIK